MKKIDFELFSKHSLEIRVHQINRHVFFAKHCICDQTHWRILFNTIKIYFVFKVGWVLGSIVKNLMRIYFYLKSPLYFLHSSFFFSIVFYWECTSVLKTRQGFIIWNISKKYLFQCDNTHPDSLKVYIKYFLGLVHNTIIF